MFEKKPTLLVFSFIIAILVLAGILYGLNQLRDIRRVAEDVENIEGGVVDEDTETTMNRAHAILRTNKGDIEIELFDEEAPKTVANFVALAENGFYNGTKIHRAIAGFMIQGGDPLTKDDSARSRWGTGGPGYTIADEFSEEFSNTRGTISMANTGQPNSGGSQFFINVADNTFLDFNKEPFASKHPVFGRVVRGMDVVDAISALPTQPPDRPVEDVVIAAIEIVQ